MNQGIKVFICPVKDIAQAKTLYSKLLGIEPYVDGAYYVGFKVGDQELGLDPNGHNKGMTGPVGYWPVNNIKKSLQSLLDAGAQIQVRLHCHPAVMECANSLLHPVSEDADGLFSPLHLPVRSPRLRYRRSRGPPFQPDRRGD